MGDFLVEFLFMLPLVVVMCLALGAVCVLGPREILGDEDHSGERCRECDVPVHTSYKCIECGDEYWKDD